MEADGQPDAPHPIPTGSCCPQRWSSSTLFLVPTVASLWFSLTRWDLFEAAFHRLGQLPPVLQGAVPGAGAGQHADLCRRHLGREVGAGAACWRCLLTSGIWCQGFLRSVVFFPVLVSTIGVGIAFTALMHPTKGVDQPGPVLGRDRRTGWLSDPALALYSVALIDVWKGVGLATLIYIAGLAAISPRVLRGRRIDGATRLQQFWRVTVPLVRPATVTVVTLSLIGGPAVLRYHLGHDARRAGLCVGRARERDLQAIPGRVLRPCDGRATSSCSC